MIPFRAKKGLCITECPFIQKGYFISLLYVGSGGCSTCPNHISMHLISENRGGYVKCKLENDLTYQAAIVYRVIVDKEGNESFVSENDNKPVEVL